MNVHSCFYFQFRHWYSRVINASRSFLSELPLMALSVHTSSFLSKLSLVVVPSVVTRFHTNLIIFESNHGHAIWIHSCDFVFQCLGAIDVDERIQIIVSVLVRPSVWLSLYRALTKLVTLHFCLPWIVVDFLLNNQRDALIIQIYSVIKPYMFRASSLPVIRSFLLYIRHC
jgi:hypothetical protein